jgi:hypothetical protein
MLLPPQLLLLTLLLLLMVQGAYAERKEARPGMLVRVCVSV